MSGGARLSLVHNIGANKKAPAFAEAFQFISIRATPLSPGPLRALRPSDAEGLNCRVLGFTIKPPSFSMSAKSRPRKPGYKLVGASK